MTAASPINYKALLKQMVAPGNEAHFVRYFDGQLWYVIKDQFGAYHGGGMEIPVPISDIGNATFLARDKSLLFMRYIRKHLDMLEKAQSELFT